jgi:hypothetical protein
MKNQEWQDLHDEISCLKEKDESTFEIISKIETQKS